MGQTPKNGVNADNELYEIYARWSGQLHFYVMRELGCQINCEFLPAPKWQMKLYPGPLREATLEVWNFSTVPKFVAAVNAVVIDLPRPESRPSQKKLEQTFRSLCLIAAQILKIDLGKPKLRHGMDPLTTDSGNDQANESRKPKRVRAGNSSALPARPSSSTAKRRPGKRRAT